jgi:malonyl-CoA O-methyltransferase
MSVFDARAVRRAFGRAAQTYPQAAALQREVESRLLEQLQYLDDRVPVTVLDLGSGPGSASAALKARWGRRSRVLALDLALPMLRAVRAKSRFWRPIHAVQADARALPFADGAFDLVFSNLCLQWVADLPRALGELRRVMREGGLLVFSTFGPDTLVELREAYAQAGIAPPLSPFAAIQQVGDALVAQGFKNPVLERDRFTLTYPDASALMRELKAIGATDARVERPRGLSGRGRHRAVAAAYEPLRRDGVLPSTWEVITAMAWAPPPGTARRDGGADIASFPVSALRVRRR